MASTMEQTQAKASIFIDGVLFDLDSYWWKGFVQLEAEDIEAIKAEIPDVVQLGRVRLLKHEAFKDFQLIEGKARLAVEKYSYPFMISTVRFVPYNVLPDLIDILEGLKKAFQVYVENFIFKYEENRENYLMQYVRLANRIKDRYPDVMKLRSRFYFGWTFFEMAMPEGVRAEIADTQQLSKIQDAWQNSQNEVSRRLDKWVDDIGAAMRKEIFNTCKNMQEKLEEGKVIRESTLETARETIRRLRTMNFIGDKQVESMVDDLAKSLPGNAERDIPAIASAFKGSLESIVKEAGDLSDVSEFTGEYKRRFIL